MVLTLNTRLAQLFEMQHTAIELLAMRYTQLHEEDRGLLFDREPRTFETLHVQLSASAGYARLTGETVIASLCEEILKGMDRATLMAKEIYPGDYYNYIVTAFQDLCVEAIILGL